MKKILLLLVVSFFMGKNCEAQNLVPNPSFEDTVSCPDWQGQVDKANGWTSFWGSPDYFNSCSHSWGNAVGIPVNMFGCQNAANGNAYCGGIAFVNNPGNDFLREIVGRNLSSPLFSGTKYYASVKVSLSDSSQFASNKFGISFTTFPNDTNFSYSPLTNHAFVCSSTIISDTTNWTIISGSFVADSAYQYIMVGNFFADSFMNTTNVPSSSSSAYIEAYYYIDDVCVSPDSLECDLNPDGIYNLKEANASINLYPNPATEQLIIDNGQWIIKGIEISDALGRVQSCEFKVQRPSTQIDIHSLPSGLYFIKVYFADGSMELRKFVKE